jgi:hypothetical protein
MAENKSTPEAKPAPGAQGTAPAQAATHETAKANPQEAGKTGFESSFGTGLKAEKPQGK